MGRFRVSYMYALGDPKAKAGVLETEVRCREALITGFLY